MAKILKKIWIFPILFILVTGWYFSNSDWLYTKWDSRCVFCDESVIGSQTIYRGEKASILATHKPVVKGHLLVIPNRHVETFDGLTTEELIEMSALVKKAHFGKEYVLLQKNGILAGQSVPHVHFHLLPREKEMGLFGFTLRILYGKFLKALSKEEMKEYVNELSAMLEGSGHPRYEIGSHEEGLKERAL